MTKTQIRALMARNWMRLHGRAVPLLGRIACNDNGEG
jgi:hypothetical protein